MASDRAMWDLVKHLERGAPSTGAPRFRVERGPQSTVHQQLSDVRRRLEEGKRRSEASIAILREPEPFTRPAFLPHEDEPLTLMKGESFSSLLDRVEQRVARPPETQVIVGDGNVQVGGDLTQVVSARFGGTDSGFARANRLHQARFGGIDIAPTEPDFHLLGLRDDPLPYDDPTLHDHSDIPSTALAVSRPAQDAGILRLLGYLVRLSARNMWRRASGWIRRSTHLSRTLPNTCYADEKDA